MRKTLIATAIAAAFCFSPLAMAAEPGDERVAHFKGQAAETLEEATANFSEYNRRLEAILAGEITNQSMAEIHVLTYTLENALEKINEELQQLADKLEELHVASETYERDSVVRHGRDYLVTARKVVK